MLSNFSHILVSRITLYSILYHINCCGCHISQLQHSIESSLLWKSDYLGRWVVVVVLGCVCFSDGVKGGGGGGGGGGLLFSFP